MKRIITIGRQFGAGGGEIGRRVARELGIEYVDRDLILRTAAESMQLTPEEVRKWDEKVPHDVGFAQSLFNFYSRPLSDELWNAQVGAIRKLADSQSCVIVGRNADYILREFDHCLRIFVHADRNWRMAHMAKLMPNATPEAIEADMRAADKARRNYCAHYTGQVYGAAENYDLTLCTSKLGIDKCVALVLAASDQL
ncbi:AAA family ATPase [uncultured Gemmiger sp.]|uniref:cytidylate kinase-like family protein n=1 Tax=uncultured Gemmiger sp. TaxID=1623490 RepID=UPI0025EF2D23|nr:cytidylate kinase-like family protein [uncultured Gemmiger sp.]